jgi:hypothetical protein
MYHINEGLSVVSTEVTNRLYLVLAREDCLNQRNDLVWKEGTIYQASEGWRTEVDGDG